MTSLTKKFYTRQGRLIEVDGEVTYNIGCGKRKYENVIGIDVLKKENVDIVHDLNIFPWPGTMKSATFRIF